MYLFNQSNIDKVIFKAPSTHYEDQYIKLLTQHYELPTQSIHLELKHLEKNII